MSKESNAYIIIFASVMAILIAVALGAASEGLKPRQEAAVALDTQKQILSAVVPLSEVGQTPQAISEYYAKHIESIAVDVNGDVKETNESGERIIPEKVSIRKEFKKPSKDEKILPVFIYKDDAGKPQAYILPTYGNGLWDNIWGYVALSPDMNTIKGTVFAHKGETPGLGARIADQNVQDRFKGKKIYDESGNLKSVEMIKGEGNVDANALGSHQVDGLSGATITARGLNAMLENYFGLYQNYINKVKKTASKQPVTPVLAAN